MKILYLFNEINYSGAEIMYADAAPILQREGYEIIVFVTGASLGNYVEQYKRLNIKIYHKPIYFTPLSIKGVKYYKSLFSFLTKENVSVLHIHRSNLFFAGFVAWLAKVKCIKTQHNNFSNRWFTLPYAITIRFFLRYFFNTKFQTISQSVYNNELNYYKNPSVKINNWVNDKIFYPVSSEEERIAIKSYLNIPRNIFVIISTGSCSYIKNHADILYAIASLKNKVNCIYIHLGHGSLECDEIALSKKLGISDSVRFLGNQSNVRDYLIASDLYVMPSKFEGLGNAAIEAMACKVPVILYNVPGLRDLVKEDNNGFLIQGSSSVLAEKILYVYKNPEVANEKANNGFFYVKKEFSISRSMKDILNLYK